MNQIPENCLFLHASSVIVENRAILFLGHSTAGKSTIARLLSRDFQVLADDTVLAVQQNRHQWLIYDGKDRSGNGALFFRECVEKNNADDCGKIYAPLASCVRIYKSHSVRMKPVASKTMARYLMDAVMEVDLQRGPKFKPSGTPVSRDLVEEIRSRRLHWFHMTAGIARTFSGWDLWFPNHVKSLELAEAVKLIAADLKIN